MAVIWRARALADIGRIVRYIATDNPIAARRVGRELLLAGDSLTMFPRRGRRGRQPGTRELVALPPYIIVNRVAADDTVTICPPNHSVHRRAPHPIAHRARAKPRLREKAPRPASRSTPI